MNEIHSRSTILTIEDDSIIRKAIGVYLRNSAGHTVLEAQDGVEGLEIFRRAGPDLVLTDLRLPKMDGMQVLETIKRESPDTPVIIVSGMGTMDDAIRALKLGAVDYVKKPITDMILLEHSVRRSLEMSRLIKENRRYNQFLEDEIDKKTAELNQSQKLEAIGTLAGGIAHDFNNILSAIMGFTEIAIIKTRDNEDLKQDLLQIRKASKRAQKLIMQILTFSRRTSKERRPIQPVLLIKESLNLLRATLPTTVELKQSIGGKDLLIQGDPTEIHQVITNLCTNAFHALENEQGEIKVSIDRYLVKKQTAADLPNKGEYLRIKVSDSGRGMDKETMEKIFDPFFTTKEKEQGTGLGLSVVHGIVKESGGFISVNSVPGQGSTFTLLFPTVDQDTTQEPEAVVNLPGGNEHILFVDDEIALRTVAERMLDYLGYKVTCCAAGADALAVLGKKDHEIDLVITDQSMPGMPGTELVKAIDAICPGMPVILCTGYSSMVDDEKADSLGIRGFLLKPLSINRLALEIRKILDH